MDERSKTGREPAKPQIRLWGWGSLAMAIIAIALIVIFYLTTERPSQSIKPAQSPVVTRR